MKLCSNLANACLLLTLGACGDDVDGGTDAFVEYWADSSKICEKLDECELVSESECLSTSASESRVAEAVKLAKFDANDRAACQRAARASDACFLKLTCADLQVADKCEMEGERVELECAALLRALELLDERDPEEDEPNKPNTKPTFGERLCHRIAVCTGEPLDHPDVLDCIDDLDGGGQRNLPDAEATATCFEKTACDDLLDDPETVLLECVDLDPKTTRCLDAQTLKACNSAGACSEVDCFASCGAWPAGVDLCKFNASAGHDICDCNF